MASQTTACANLQDFKLGGEDVEVLVDAGGVVQESGAVISCGVYSGTLYPVEALRRVNVKRHRHESHRPIELLREVGQQRVIGATQAASIAGITQRRSARRCRGGSWADGNRAIFGRYGDTSGPEGSIRAPYLPHAVDRSSAPERKSCALRGFCRAL